MHPPTKDQTTLNVDNPKIDASDGAIIEQADGTTIENKDVTRQEYAQEADVNHMLARFNIVPPRGTPTYGEVDDSLDLQQALNSTREAKLAYNRLPPELRNKFRSLNEMLEAAENGSLVIKDEEPPLDARTDDAKTQPPA